MIKVRFFSDKSEWPASCKCKVCGLPVDNKALMTVKDTEGNIMFYCENCIDVIDWSSGIVKKGTK